METRTLEVTTDELEIGDVILWTVEEDEIVKIGEADASVRRIDVLRNCPGVVNAAVWFWSGTEATHTVRRTV